MGVKKRNIFLKDHPLLHPSKLEGMHFYISSRDEEKILTFETSADIHNCALLVTVVALILMRLCLFVDFNPLF